MSIITISLTSSALILLLLLFEGINNRTAGKKFSAKCRYLLWAVLLLRLAIPLTVPLVTLDVPNAADSEPAPSAPYHLSQPEDNPNAPLDIPEDTIFTAPLTSQTVTENAPDAAVAVTPLFVKLWSSITRFFSSAVFTWVWLTGAALFAAIKLGSHAVYTVRLKKSLRLADNETYALYARLAEKYRIGKPPALYVSDCVESPLLYGYFKPRILLPATVWDEGFAQSNAAVVILFHELTHHRRGDLWVKLICLWAQAFHWFNPLVHLAARRCAQAMELSCDEAVLAGHGEEVRRSYGNVMLDIVKRCRNQRDSLSTHFNPKKSAVVERFVYILDGTKKRRGIAIIALLLLVCAVGCTVTMHRETDQPPVSRTPSETDAPETDAPETSEAELPEEPYTLTVDERRALTQMYTQHHKEQRTIAEIMDAAEARKNLANAANEILRAIQKGNNPFDLMPNPLLTALDTLPFPASKVPLVTEAYVAGHWYTNSETRTSQERYILRVDIPDTDYCILLFWDIAIFGDSVSLYINHLLITENNPLSCTMMDGSEGLDELEKTVNNSTYDYAFDYIRAFLAHDAVTLASLCGVEPAMYADYATMTITEWAVSIKEGVLFTFRSPDTEVDGFSREETNAFYISNGVYAVYLRPAASQPSPTEESAQAVNLLLQSVYFEAIPTTTTEAEQHRWDLTDYICGRLSEKTGKLFHTAAEIREEIAFRFHDSIPTFTLSQYHSADWYIEDPDRISPHPTYRNNIDEMEMGDAYAAVPHGGIVRSYRIVDVKETETEASVTVRFYADLAATVNSHLYEYVLEKKDGEWTFRQSNLVEEAPYSPFCTGT